MVTVVVAVGGMPAGGSAGAIAAAGRGPADPPSLPNPPAPRAKTEISWYTDGLLSPSTVVLAPMTSTAARPLSVMDTMRGVVRTVPAGGRGRVISINCSPWRTPI